MARYVHINPEEKLMPQRSSYKRHIACIGAGYVGGPTMAMIAARCPQYKVTVVDINAARIESWNSDTLPIYEPGLIEVVKIARGRNLFFSTEVEAAIREAEIIFVSVNTPTKTFGEGAGRAADLQHWERTARMIVREAASDKIIVEKSTLPVRTAAAMSRILNANDKGIHFEVVSNPEFLAEGTAVADIATPDRVLIGAQETPQGVRARDAIVEIYANWVGADKILTSNVWSAELSKLVANAFLAQRISSINSISALCEKTAANVMEVSHAIGMDGRIGPRFLAPSIGFGGSCFKKDILNLVYICQSYGLTEAARYWESVVAMNDYQRRRFVSTMVNAMFNTIAGKRIAIFGFAFKADTGDTRESPAIGVAEQLIEERAQVVITDPQALENAKTDLAAHGAAIEFTHDPYAAAKGAHAIALCTEWQVYRDLDYRRIVKSMEKPAFIFDGRNILDHEALFKLGFNVYSIGQEERRHF
jgi:UDPglucose 6-dehydrogenase